MKRVMTIALAAAFACSLGASAVYAGPACCKSKMDTKDVKLSSVNACAMGEFPHLKMIVGDKEFDCPASADKAAEAAGTKVRFAVASEQFDCKEAAMAALADHSERYVKRFMTVAAVVDGKMIYNKEDMGDCSKTACAEGKDGAKAVLASAGEGRSCSAKAAALAKAEGSSCSKSKAELAKADGASCSKSKAALASAEDKKEGSGCCKAKAALASAEGKSCSTKGGDAMKSAMAVVSKEEFAKLCKTEGAKFMVLGRSFDCYDSAVKARDTAAGAAKVVKMKYIVDGKEVACSTEICPSAKKDGKVQYVIGEDKTGCETVARINLAKAQYDAAKKAADQKLASM